MLDAMFVAVVPGTTYSSFVASQHSLTRVKRVQPQLINGKRCSKSVSLYHFQQQLLRFICFNAVTFNYFQLDFVVIWNVVGVSVFLRKGQFLFDYLIFQFLVFALVLCRVRQPRKKPVQQLTVRLIYVFCVVQCVLKAMPPCCVNLKWRPKIDPRSIACYSFPAPPSFTVFLCSDCSESSTLFDTLPFLYTDFCESGSCAGCM